MLIRIHLVKGLSEIGQRISLPWQSTCFQICMNVGSYRTGVALVEGFSLRPDECGQHQFVQLPVQPIRCSRSPGNR